MGSADGLFVCFHSIVRSGRTADTEDCVVSCDSGGVLGERHSESEGSELQLNVSDRCLVI
jgi:hypothetical protein